MSRLLRGFGLAAALAAAGCAGEGNQPDLVVFARIWTGDSARPFAGAMAVKADTVYAVDDSLAIEALIGPRTERLDYPGQLVVPGLIDDHVHLFAGGFQLTSVDLRTAGTPEEFARRIGEFAQTVPAGTWIQGGDWDHEGWPGTPLPDRSWIDSLTPDHPVFVNRLDGHMALANSAALRAAGLDRSAASPPGGEIVRRADGELTGVLKDAAMDRVYSVIPAPSAEQRDSALVRAMRHAASLGVTGVSSVSTAWPEVAALRRARARDALTLRVASYFPLADWRSVAESLRGNGPGDDWIRVAGVKGFVDGSLGSTTALFDRPYDDAPATSGLFVTPEDSLRAWIGAADSAGLDVAVHAIGDRANGVLLDIFDSVATAHGARDRRWRIEHAQHLRPADIPRFAALGVVPSMQPYHAADDGRWAEKRIGPERIQTTYAFRSLLDAGARLTFGSDWTVAPLDPILGLKAAVTRQTIDGRYPEGWVPAQKITVDEALRAYTANNAYAMHLERSVGRLTPGRQADFAVLSRNLLAIQPAWIDSTRVVLTAVGGRVVYRAP
ncbi:MAG: amidohydrolase [Gemmatimonadales bacterium]